MPNPFYGFPGTLQPFTMLFGGKVSQIGNSGNSNGSGTFKRFTQEIVFYKPFRIDFIFWDITTSQTYSIQVVDSLAAAPTVLKTIVDSVALTGGPTKNRINFPQTVYAPSGKFYLSLFCNTLVTQRRNTTNPVTFDNFGFYNIGLDGINPTVGTAPLQITGQYWELKRSANL